MSVELPSSPGIVEERLASLEDPILAERLFLEHPTLYADEPDEPPHTERGVLAWATRRFGTIALAVTATASIAAGYVVTSLQTQRNAPAQPAPQPKPAAAAPAPARPAAQRHVVKKAAPAHPVYAAHRSALIPAAPAAMHVAPPHPIVRRTTVVHAPVVLRHPNREAAALRARLQAQEAELAALRKRAAHEEALARSAQARASAAIAAAHNGAATRTAPAPLPQPRTQPIPADVAAPSTTTDPAVPVGVDAPVDAPTQHAGTKMPAPNGGWTERPPVPIYGSGPGPVAPGGTNDPCTPQGGRLGIIIHSLLGGRSGIGSVHLQF